MTRAEKFKKELASLCKKYDCEIILEDHSNGYNRNYKMTAYIDADYSGEIVMPDEILDLGSYFNGDLS